jgi:tetratricopeptide (TPR) repeat protein
MLEKNGGISLLIVLSILLIACKRDQKDSTGNLSNMDSIGNILMVDSSMSDSVRLQIIEKLVNADQLNAAIKNIDFLLQKSPDNPAFLFMKADVLERRKDTSQAILYYEKADGAAGLFLQAKMKLLQLYAETGNDSALSLTDTLMSLPQAQKNHSDILLMKGIYFTRKAKWKEAEKTFDFIMKNDYTCLQAYLEKGWILYDQNQYQKALDIFEQSTVVKNDFADGYFWMGKTYLKLNQREAAIVNFKKSLVLDQELQEARDELKSLGAIQ